MRSNTEMAISSQRTSALKSANKRTSSPASTTAGRARSATTNGAMEDRVQNHCRPVSAVRRIQCDHICDLALPAVAVGEEPLLVVVKFFARFRRKLEIRSLDDRVDRTGLLAQAAIDALDHVDVVARRPPSAVVPPRTGLDRDRLRRANRLA